MTDEIRYAEELIFKKNMYVRRVFGKGSSYSEHPPSLFSLNETTTPKQIDMDIMSAAQMKASYATWPKDDINLSIFMRDYINKNQVLERRLGIYELKDNEFKYLISGGIPFTLVNKEFVLNPQSPFNKRATSFATADGTIVIYKRVQRSLKDSSNTKLETPDDSRFKPPTGTPGETPTTKAPASTELSDLRQQRLKLAQERMKLWRESRFTGTPQFDDLGAISQQILDATLALATDKATRLRAMEEHLKILIEMEKTYEQRFQTGGRTKYTLLAFRLRRIEFEIQLQELKEKR